MVILKDSHERFFESSTFLFRKLKRDLTSDEIQLLLLISEDHQQSHEALMTILLDLSE